MEIETQVVDEALLQEEITNQATVAKFKSELANLRAFKFECFHRLKNLRDKLEKMSESRAYLLSMFDTEAMKMYPELTEDSIGQTLESVDPAHPLALLWEQYAEKIAGLDSDAISALEMFDGNEAEYIQADEQEVALLEAYAAFASEASTLVPSVEEMEMMLQSEESIPQVDEASLIADISAISELSPEAADMITLQKVEEEEAVAQAEAEVAIAEYDRSLEKQFNPLGLILAASAVYFMVFS